MQGSVRLSSWTLFGITKRCIILLSFSYCSSFSVATRKSPASYARLIITAVQYSTPLEIMSPVIFCVLEVLRLYRPKTYPIIFSSSNSILLNKEALRPTSDHQSLKIQYLLLSAHNPNSFSIDHPCQIPSFSTNIENGTIPVYQ